MGELYERILSDGAQGSPERLKIGHWFESLMGEYAAADITGAEAVAAFEQITGSAITATIQQEVQDIIATVTAIPAPATPAVLGNSPTANALRDYARAWGERDQGLALRAHKIRRITQILVLAQRRVQGYSTPAELRAKLGVPNR